MISDPDPVPDAPALRSFTVDTNGYHHKVCWHEWGDPRSSRLVLCVHAINRNGRDFDVLARALRADHRVVCVDLPGRGHSERLPNPGDYHHDTYLRVIEHMLNELGTGQVPFDWVGTSLGGLLGIRFAATQPQRLRRLVINDVGAEVSGEVFRQAARSIGRGMRFRDLDHAVLTFKIMTAACGPLTDEEWRAASTPMVEPAEGGGFVLRYDPAIAVRLGEDGDLDLWDDYRRVRSPVLLIHGERSDVLTKDLVAAMCYRNPRTQVFSVAGTGHFPMLIKPSETAAVKDFLNGSDVP